MKGLLCKSEAYLKRFAPTILTVAGAVGVVVTTIMTVKATTKAVKCMEKEKREKKLKPLTKKEVVRLTWKCYIPTATIGVATIGCMIGSNVLNKKRQESLISAYVLLNGAYIKYKDKVRSLLGEKASGEVESSIINDKYKEGHFSASGDRQLFYEEHYGQFFERTKEEVLMAEYELNRILVTSGYVTLNTFYELLGLPKNDTGEFIGWGDDDFSGRSWIDFDHTVNIVEENESFEGLECNCILMITEPSVIY